MNQLLKFKQEAIYMDCCLNELGTFYGGLSGKTKEHFGTGDAKFVTYMNVFSNCIARKDQCECVLISDDEKQNLVKKGDILFTQSSETPEEVGMASIWTHDLDVYLNSFCFGFRVLDPKKTNPLYLTYLLRSPKYRQAISIEAQGISRYNLSSSRLSSLKLRLHSCEEQQKIAEFFTVLDEKIRLNATKLSNIRSLKSNIARTVLFQHKGIQLNSWVEVQLSDVAEFIKTRDTFDSCIYVGTEHLNKDFGGLCKEVKDTASGVVFKENDILLSNIRPYLKKLWLSDCKGVCSADVLVIRSKSTILPSLLKHILSTEVFFDYVAKGYKGSKMPRGDKDHIELFEFMIPSDLEVQRKIADQLDLFEMMIFCLIKKNKHLELLKKAFMQRMFV